VNVLLHDPIALDLALTIRDARRFRSEIPSVARLSQAEIARMLPRLRSAFRSRQRRCARSRMAIQHRAHAETSG
jgi:hypothetical protein